MPRPAPAAVVRLEIKPVAVVPRAVRNALIFLVVNYSLLASRLEDFQDPTNTNDEGEDTETRSGGGSEITRNFSGLGGQ